MTLAVLFDFNGVLVDDEDVHFEAFRRALAVFDLTIEHHVYRRYLGFDDRNTIVALLSHYGRSGAADEERLARLVVEKQNVYAALAGRHPRLGFGARRSCGRCARPARAWRSCRGRGAPRSTTCSTRRRCARPSTS